MFHFGLRGLVYNFLISSSLVDISFPFLWDEVVGLFEFGGTNLKLVAVTSCTYLAISTL